MATKNDETVKKLIKLVEKKKAEMGKRPKVSLETNGVFKFRSGGHLNLNTVSSTRTLVSALSFLLQEEGTSERAAEMLGVEVPEFTWDNYTVAQWAGDFKQVSRLIEWRGKKKQLDALNKKLDQLRSEEVRTEMELDSIAKMLED